MFDYIKNWLATIQQKHGVNPLIFGTLYLICAVPFWFSIYRVIAGIKAKNARQVTIYGLILAIAIITPYGYVAVFGRNLPTWFWVLLVAIVVSSAWSILKRIRRGQGSKV